MKKIKIDIHIGDSKTGSTAIQTLLSRNQNCLEKAGVSYAKSGRASPKAIGHHMLPRDLFDICSGKLTGSTGSWRALQREIDSGTEFNRFIISSEGFSSIMELEQAEQLKKLLDSYDVNFYLVLRKPDDWIESIYSQFIKAPPFTCSKFETFSKNFELRGYTAALLLSEYFDKNRFSIIKYSNEAVESLASALDLNDIIPFEQDASVNARPSSRLTSVFFALNHINIPTDKRVHLYKYISDYCKEYSGKDFNVHNANLYDFDNKDRALYLKSKHKLIRNFEDRFEVSLAGYLDV